MDNDQKTPAQKSPAQLAKEERIAEFKRRFPTQDDFFAAFIRLEDALVQHLGKSPDFGYRKPAKPAPAPEPVAVAAPVPVEEIE